MGRPVRIHKQADSRAGLLHGSPRPGRTTPKGTADDAFREGRGGSYPERGEMEKKGTRERQKELRMTARAQGELSNNNERRGGWRKERKERMALGKEVKG